jgi:hypothetical protein
MWSTLRTGAITHVGCAVAAASSPRSITTSPRRPPAARHSSREAMGPKSQTEAFQSLPSSLRVRLDRPGHRDGSWCSHHRRIYTPLWLSPTALPPHRRPPDFRDRPERVSRSPPHHASQPRVRWCVITRLARGRASIVPRVDAATRARRRVREPDAGSASNHCGAALRLTPEP